MARPASKSLLQATLEAPHLARFTELIKTSNNMLAAIENLMPIGLRQQVKAGPLGEDSWCLVVENNSVAAKLRQLQPTLEAHLRTKGWNIKSIRFKVAKQDKL